MSTVLVTGATGLTGGNVCRVGVENGDTIIALVRPGSDTAELEALGVRIHRGDVAETSDVLAAAQGVDGIVHCAAVLGGTWGSPDPVVHDRVNFGGTVNVLDAARAVGAKVCAISTGSILVPSTTEPWTEATPISEPNPGMESNYVRTKRMAQIELERRVAEEGLHAVALVPAAIYGPSPVTKRALDPSGLDAAILRAVRGQLPRYPAIYAGWVLAEQVARRALLALDRGQPGVRYFAMGDARDRQAHPEFFSMACELAGVDARVAATPNPDEDPSVVEEFGTYAYMAQIARPDPLFDDSLTLRTLGDPPVSLAEGLPATIAWLKEIGEI